MIRSNPGAQQKSQNAGWTLNEPGFTSLVAILEVARVLKSLLERLLWEIANDLEMILAADTIEVQNEQQVYQAVGALRNGTGTFEDALTGSLGTWRGCSTTLTSDEKDTKMLHGFSLA